MKRLERIVLLCLISFVLSCNEENSKSIQEVSEPNGKLSENNFENDESETGNAEIKTYFVIYKDGLRIRDNYGLDSDIISTLPAGTILQYLGRKSGFVEINGNSDYWYEVSIHEKPETTGWVFGAYIMDITDERYIDALSEGIQWESSIELSPKFYNIEWGPDNGGFGLYLYPFRNGTFMYYYVAPGGARGLGYWNQIDYNIIEMRLMEFEPEYRERSHFEGKWIIEPAKDTLQTKYQIRNENSSLFYNLTDVKEPGEKSIINGQEITLLKWSEYYLSEVTEVVSLPSGENAGLFILEQFENYGETKYLPKYHKIFVIGETQFNGTDFFFIQTRLGEYDGGPSTGFIRKDQAISINEGNIDIANQWQSEEEYRNMIFEANLDEETLAVIENYQNRVDEILDERDSVDPDENKELYDELTLKYFNVLTEWSEMDPRVGF